MKINELHLLCLATQAKLQGLKCGYLLKKSGKKPTVDHNQIRWQKRWCAVHLNFFFYYETEHSSKPQGVIILDGVITDRLDVAEIKRSHFSIGLPGEDLHRHFMFGCTSETECTEWLQVIINASSHNALERNNNLINTVLDLEAHISSLKNEKEKLRKELSDHYSQVSRLKLELSSVRNQAESVRTCIQRRTSLPDSTKCDDSGTFSITSSSDKEYSNEDIAKLIKLQSFIRSWLLQRRWRGVIKSYINTFTAEKLKRRNKLLWQFITAEEDYVQQMKVLVNIFLIPMKEVSYTSQQCITNNEVLTIFGNSESILVLHKIFVEGMEARIKNWPAVHIDDLLFAIVAAVPIYIEYIKNHPEALKVLALCKKRKDFVKLLNWCEGREDCHGQTIEQFLLYPVRVMPTYVRNIYEILEVTPENHAERKSLESILFKLQEAQSYGNYLDEGESIRHTLEIERLIDGGCRTLLEPNQKFIRHGVLKQISQEHSGKREKTRHCFLFSQHLILGSRTVDGHLRLPKQCGEIPLAQTTIVEEDSNLEPLELSDYAKSTSFVLKVSCDENRKESFTVVLKASKTSEKNLWTTDVSQCIYNLLLEKETEEDSISSDDVTDANEKVDEIVETSEPELSTENRGDVTPPLSPYALGHRY